ncbi:MAG TPA: hypothetical protein VMV20_01135 [Chitinophagaceae bacterium]|nr:hypothetical protein [Chitinophagaceae bacterium]
MKSVFRFAALTFLVLGSRTLSCPGQSLAQRFGEPLVILQEFHPGKELLALNEPDFVIYSSGQVIYKVQHGSTREFREERFTRAATQLLIFDLDLTDSLMGLPDRIQASDLPNQPSFQLILNFDSVKSIRVYGNVRDSSGLVSQRIPLAFREAFRRIIHFGDPKDTVWIPDRFEVLFSVDQNPSSHPIPWPPKWPGLSDSTTVKRLPDLYSIFMDRNRYASFLEFTRTLKPGQEVEIGNLVGKIYGHFPFPHL